MLVSFQYQYDYLICVGSAKFANKRGGTCEMWNSHARNKDLSRCDRVLPSEGLLSFNGDFNGQYRLVPDRFLL
jgi:hypothetical protein